MTNRTLLTRVSKMLDRTGMTHGAIRDENSGMHLMRHEAETDIDGAVYDPLLCLVLQGAKEVVTNARTLTISAGQSLIVSHAVPVMSRIVSATPDCPYIALVFPIDLDALRSLAHAVSLSSGNKSTDPFSICLCGRDEGMEDALLRYLGQCEAEPSRDLLAPITAREIHARLLMGSHGDVLRRLLWQEGTASRILQATRSIRSNLAETIVVGDLAQRFGMSSSAFFEQFKAVTGTSPLRYQKDLRLLKARDELQTTGAKISEIAFGVGYESSAQFSREYSRKFGKSPRQDREVAAAG